MSSSCAEFIQFKNLPVQSLIEFAYVRTVIFMRYCHRLIGNWASEENFVFAMVLLNEISPNFPLNLHRTENSDLKKL